MIIWAGNTGKIGPDDRTAAPVDATARALPGRSAGDVLLQLLDLRLLVLDHRLDQVADRDQADDPIAIGHRQVPDAPVGELEDFDKQGRLMFDLVALAYQADLTRVASYVMVAEGTIVEFPLREL